MIHVEKLNFGMAWTAKDFNLIKNHAKIKIMILYQSLVCSLCRFC